MPKTKGDTKKPAMPAKKAPAAKKQRAGGPVEMPMRRPGAY